MPLMGILQIGQDIAVISIANIEDAGDFDIEQAGFGKRLRCLTDKSDWIGDMLEHVRHHDQIKRLFASERLKSAGADIKAKSPPPARVVIAIIETGDGA